MLWNNLNQNSDLYRQIQTINRYRKLLNVYTEPQVERYCDAELYAFTRGKMFVAVTNRFNQVTRTITYHPYGEGTKLCNIFYMNQDCVVVKGGSFPLYLQNAEAKIFVPV